jgi:pyruvate/2-oxoglutarate dehydrogenase complex dihydrolipoamide acyltransferase (E2) component
MAVEVFISKMTDFMEEALVRAWLVNEGDRVDEGQPLLEIETDKALAELPSPSSGYVKGIRAGAGPGVYIPVGQTIAYIVEALDEDVEALPAL